MNTLKHEPKSCPRCQAIFECKVGDVANCQCSEVLLTKETEAFLSKTQYDCLCKNCLTEVQKLVLLAESQNFPKQSHLLKEGIHYYIENGYWVFTEYYHLLRGYCCGNGCRHCAYGFEKNLIKK
jgi:hypothetical protein